MHESTPSNLPVPSVTMCGIVGYVGQQDAREVVIEGLRRLEYRGYDSAGVAVLADGALSTAKKAGKLANLEKVLAENPLPAATIGIGHTRWATHGGPTDRNAHPHVSDGRQGRGDPQRDHRELRVAAGRARGRRRRVHVRDRHRGRRSPARRAATPKPPRAGPPGRGHAPGRAAASRARSPSSPRTPTSPTRSSPPAATPRWWSASARANTSSAPTSPRSSRTPARPGELGQDQVVEIDRERGLTVTDFDGARRRAEAYTVDWDAAAAEKGGYDWFMLKEIAEQPQAVADTLLGRLGAAGELMLDEVRLSDEELRDIDKVFIVACGTAYHAGLVAKYAIEHWTRIPVEVELASEFRYRDPVLDRSTLVIAISQSGETMDTLMALRHAREQKARVLAVCNTNGSTIPRESDAVLYTHAGPEVAVASTKAFLTQLVACYLVGLFLAQVRGMKYADEIAAIVATCGAARRRRARCSTDGPGARARPATLADENTCSSSAATSATRWRSRARSSSRSSPTSTPRASPPASSSTARSPSSTRARPSCASSRRRAAGSRCTARSSPTSRRSGPAGRARS